MDEPDRKITELSDSSGAPDPTARDADKMIRQLSLIAYLMVRRGRPVDAETIRSEVEGYGGEDQNWEAFTRRFYADREELASLGIEIVHGRDEFSDAEAYWLPPENFFFPRVEFSKREMAALASCLALLEGQFAYGRVLRLALQGLALGTGNALEEAQPRCFSVDLASSGYDDEIAARQAEIERNIARRKTIRFEYYAPSSGKTEVRVVDPYGMFSSGGQWYLAGFSHERNAMRVFKLRRIRGRIRQVSKTDHNYEIPPDFRPQDYMALAPWQLGGGGAEAEISFTPRLGWWAESHLAHAGRVESAAGGGAVLHTHYDDSAALCSLVLGLQPGAEITGPPELRAAMAELLAEIAARHEAVSPEIVACARGGKPSRPEKAPAGGNPGEKRPARTAPQVQPERLALLSTTMSYLLQRLGKEEEIRLPLSQVMSELGYRTEKELAQALDMLRLVNIGFQGYLLEPYIQDESVLVKSWPEGDTFARPVHLSPREATALLLAIDLVGPHIPGDSGEPRGSGSVSSLSSAREKIMQAACGGQDPTAVVGDSGHDDRDICAAVNRALEKGLVLEIEYLSSGSTKPERRKIEPYLINKTKGQTYLVAWCRRAEGMRTFRYEMIRSVRVPGDKFDRRPPAETGLDRFVADPLRPSGRAAPHIADVWFSADAAPWALERYEDVTELEDGAALARIPFFDDEWLVSEIFGYGGRAVLVAPADRRPLIARAAAALIDTYS